LPSPEPTSQYESTAWDIWLSTYIVTFIVLVVTTYTFFYHEKRGLIRLGVLTVAFSWLDFAMDVNWGYQMLQGGDLSDIPERYVDDVVQGPSNSEDGKKRLKSTREQFGVLALIFVANATFFTTVVVLRLTFKAVQINDMQMSELLKPNNALTLLIACTNPECIMLLPWESQAYRIRNSVMPNSGAIQASLVKGVEDLPEITLQVLYLYLIDWDIFTVLNLMTTVMVLILELASKAIRVSCVPEGDTDFIKMAKSGDYNLVRKSQALDQFVFEAGVTVKALREDVLDMLADASDQKDRKHYHLSELLETSVLTKLHDPSESIEEGMAIDPEDFKFRKELADSGFSCVGRGSAAHRLLGADISRTEDIPRRSDDELLALGFKIIEVRRLRAAFDERYPPLKVEAHLKNLDFAAVDEAFQNMPQKKEQMVVSEDLKIHPHCAEEATAVRGEMQLLEVKNDTAATKEEQDQVQENEDRDVQPMLARQFSSSTETLMAQIFERSNENLISDENEAAVKQEENDASEEDYGAQLTGQAMPESEVTEEAMLQLKAILPPSACNLLEGGNNDRWEAHLQRILIDAKGNVADAVAINDALS